MRYRNALVLTAAAGGLLLGACGDRSPSVNSETRSTADFRNVRPGDAVERYLGVRISSDYLDRIEAAGRIAAAQCGVSFTPPKRTDRMTLRMDDLPSFRAQYGYGVIAGLIDAQEIAMDDNDAGDGGSVDISRKCEGEISLAMNQFSAPVMAHQSADKLWADWLSSDLGANAAKEWRACMALAGFALTEDPRSSQVIVERAQLGAVEEQLRREGREFTEGEEVVVQLAEAEIDRLLQYENEAFTADAACLDSTGVGDTMMKAEIEILAALREEFRGFSGVG